MHARRLVAIAPRDGAGGGGVGGLGGQGRGLACMECMVERRRGWVMIVASTASFQPIPYLNTYAATKVFDRFFSQGLAAEVARYGVKVTALCPGPTESEFWDVSGASAFKRRVQSTPEVARLGVNALARGKRIVIANVSGRITAFMVRFLPVNVITHFIEKVARREALPH